MMKASIGHTVLLKAFNNDDYLSTSIEEIDKFEMDYTNLTPTTLPSSTVKGLFYMKNGK